ncbi:MAG: ABC transporter permease [Gemmatimonadota bacterium]|nr:ABC transporter permease [Gemmatimonadota bacterium]
MTASLRFALRDRRVLAGGAILGAFALAGLLAPWIVPHDPLAQPDILRTRFLAPLAAGPDGAVRWLGTDQLGRDLLSRLAYGARISLAVGVLAAVLAAVIGTAIGAFAALFRGAVERVLMAATDAALALPRLVLLLALVALLSPSAPLVVLVLALTGWMPVARLARAEVLGVLGRPYADAARAAGSSPVRLLVRHLLPNALTPVIVATALGVGNAITLEAGLAFLGLGIPAPTPSWGNMIASGRDALVQAPWIATFPGLAVALAVVGCNLVGDGIRDAMDPTAR